MVSGTSVTHKCEQHSVFRFGRKLVIVDTPGIFDTDESNEKNQEEIYKCIGITSPGPHAFILVISIAARYTEEEHRSVEHFVKYFGEKAHSYFIILFTRKDELEANDTLTNYVKRYPANLKHFIQKCGGKICAFNNTLTGEKQDEQVIELMEKIENNLDMLGGKCYTNEMYEEAETIIKQQEEDLLRKKKEKREKEFQALKERITKEFNEKIAQEKENIRIITDQLNDLIQGHKRKDDQIAFLMKQIQEHKDEKQKMDQLNKELAIMKKEKEQEKKLIEELQRSKEATEIRQTKLFNDFDEKLEQIKTELTKDMNKMNNKVRDELREKFERKCNIS